MMKYPLLAATMATLVLLAATPTQAQVTPGALYDVRASNNPGGPNSLTNLGTAGGAQVPIEQGGGAAAAPPARTPDGHYSYWDVQAVDTTWSEISGNSPINIPAGNGYTYEIFLRQTGTGFGGTDNMVSAIESNGNVKAFLLTRDGTDDFALDIEITDFVSQERVLDFAATPQNEWTHVIYKLDPVADTFTTYVNGGGPTVTNLANDYTLPTTDINNLSLFKWRGGEGGNNRFDGDIGAARFYNFLLTDQQALDNYLATVPEPSTVVLSLLSLGLIGWRRR